MVHHRRDELRLRLLDVGEPGTDEGAGGRSAARELHLYGVCLPLGAGLRLVGSRVHAGDVELDQRRDDAAHSRARARHNFGVHHARTLSCTDAVGTRVILSSRCTTSEYGDPFSIMGASTRLHNDWHRAQLGWLTDIQTVTASGVYTLAPADIARG